MADRSGNDYLTPTIFLVIGVAALAWMIFGAEIRAATLALLRAEAAVMAPLVEVFSGEAREARFDKWRALIAQPPETLVNVPLPRLLETGGRWIQIPVFLLLLGLAVWVYRRAPSVEYTRTMDFERLLLHNTAVFPRIRPVLWLRGKVKDADRGAYTWALSPYAWAAKVGALKPSLRASETARSWNAATAERGFAAQLGGRVDLANLPFHEQIVFAALAARLMDRKKDSDALLDDAAIGFRPCMSPLTRWWRQVQGRAWDWPATGPFEIALSPKAAKTLADILAKAPEHPEVTSLLKGHAFMRTLLAAMLERAQDLHGVLTTSDMIWVKAVDRTLHYALNDVGRRVASIEASGVRAHLQVERSMCDADDPRPGAALAVPTPNVAAAVEALKTHLEETGWHAPPAVKLDAFGG